MDNIKNVHTRIASKYTPTGNFVTVDSYPTSRGLWYLYQVSNTPTRYHYYKKFRNKDQALKVFNSTNN